MTRQLAEPVVPVEVRVQLVKSKLPEAPVDEKVTVPAGVIAAPPVAVSFTVAVQAEVPETTIGLTQLTEVRVDRRFTRIVALIVAWLAS